MSDDYFRDMMDRAHEEIREERLRIEVDRLNSENERLRKALREAREALFIIAHHPIKHDPQAYAVVRGIAETAIDDADATLNALKINHLG